MSAHMMTEQEIWQHALVQIELESSEATFKTWFKNTELLRRENGDVFIGVPTKMAKDWFRDKYNKMILKVLRGVDPSIRNIEYVVHKGTRTGPIKPPHTSIGGTLPIEATFVDRKDGLNPRYTFDTFVVGPYNQLAHAATQAVIQKPGLAYNPLFIYGDTGRGKTHLIQAVGNYFKKMHPGVKVFYVNAERFAVDYLNSIQTGKANNFKNNYRQYDVLIMDDIQFFADKEKTQEELFHLFNAMYDNNKQIIFSSDKHPVHLPGIEDRLRSRFSQGMIAEIPEPDLESRVQIIRSKANQSGTQITDEMIQSVATDCRGNIRELEGIVNSIVCKQQLLGKQITYLEIKAIIKQTNKPQKGISIDEVVRKVCSFYDTDERSVYEKNRKKEVVKTRQVIMYILREEYNVSYPSIGDKLGGRDHTTVIHSCEKIKDEIKKSGDFERELDQIKGIVRG
jgi:chromosomal replication initiator protein